MSAVPNILDHKQRDRPAEGMELERLNDTDLANAQRLADRHGADLKYAPDAGWLCWDGRRFSKDEKGVHVQSLAKETVLSIYDEIRTAIDRDALTRHAKASQSRRAIEAMIVLARSEPTILASLDRFDADPMAFNVANGTVDLRKGQTLRLRPHRREDLITKIAPVAYDSNASCELWDAFLWRVIAGDDELYKYLQRLIGYVLTGLTTEQTLHFLFGLGANGKTVLCEILLALLGEYAITASPDLVMARRHAGIPNDIARLRGTRVALMNETSQGSRFDEAKLKDLTGGDTLTARFLHAEFFDFRPTHKLIIRGNHKPVITGTDDGIWRRLRLVPFNVQIPPEEQDLELLDKLKAELPGILNWAIAGCLAWQEGGLRPPTSIMDAVRKYREESDILGRFLDDGCEVRGNAQVKSSAFFAAYKSYCERIGERWIPNKDLPAEMQRRGFTHKRSTGGTRVYQGVELTASEGSWDSK